MKTCVLAMILSVACAIFGQASAAWQVVPLYTMTKKVTADGALCPGCSRVQVEGTELCPDCYASSYFMRDKTGNFEFSFTSPASHWLTYQTVSVSNTADGDPTEIVIELEYSNYACSKWTSSPQSKCPLTLQIKQLPLDYGASRLGDNFSYTANIQRFFDSLDAAPTVAEVSVDGTKQQYCPRDKYTIRFKLSDLPTAYNAETRGREQAVYAIGVPSDQSGGFKIQAMRVLSATEPIDNCPTTETACAAHSSGAISISHIQKGDEIGLLAVPQTSTYKQIVGLWVTTYLPPLFTANKVDQISVNFEFSNGTSAPFPDSCNYVTVAGSPGDEWAQVRIKYRARRFDSQGKLIETKLINTIAQKWTWKVEPPTTLKKALYARIAPDFSTDLRLTPVGVVSQTEIRLNLGQLVLLQSDLTISAGGVLKFTTLTTNSACWTDPTKAICARPTLLLDQRAWMFVAGQLIFGSYDVTGRFQVGPYVNVVLVPGAGTAIAKTSPSASIDGVVLLQADLDRNGNTDSDDAKIILNSLGSPAGIGDPRDVDGDGVLTVRDARKLMLLCTKPQCAK